MIEALGWVFLYVLGAVAIAALGVIVINTKRQQEDGMVTMGLIVRWLQFWAVLVVCSGFLLLGRWL